MEFPHVHAVDPERCDPRPGNAPTKTPTRHPTIQLDDDYYEPPERAAPGGASSDDGPGVQPNEGGGGGAKPKEEGGATDAGGADGDPRGVVALRFDAGGLPDDLNGGELEEEMAAAMNRTLAFLAERIEGFEVSGFEVDDRAAGDLQNSPNLDDDVVSLYYSIDITDDTREFGPLIIGELREGFGELLDQLR